MENTKDMEFEKRQIENKRRNLQYNSRFMLIFMGAFIGSTRLKLKVVTGTRSLPSVDADAMSLSQLGTFLPQ